MKLGIRVTPDDKTIPLINSINPACVEVRFDPSKLEDYGKLFTYLRDSYFGYIGITLRGNLPSGELINLSYPDKLLNQESIEFIQSTIKIITKYKFKYVNIYPGTRTRIFRDFATKTLIVKTNPQDLNACTDNFLDNAQRISNIFEQNGLILTFETMPPHSLHDHATVEPSPSEIHGFNLPLEVLERGATNYNLKIANNLTHTSANLPHGTREEIWQYLYGKTQMISPWTKVIYLGCENYSNMSINFPNLHIFKPTRIQLGNLLRIYSNRDDICIYPENQINQDKLYRLSTELLTDNGLYHV